ncbi:helix-turn-helix transcriptional regulator [Polaribacter sp.]|uniref:helix-turn-helix transcriptional regulator n=1 Tax=Polaribacter sp. TaxID=1920175 RepID=UPI003BB1D5BD
MDNGPQSEQTPVNMARPALSIRQATEACGVSRSTIRRYREAGKFPNAYQYGDDQAWHIPIDDLLNAGLHLTEQGKSEPDQGPEQGGGPTSEQGVKGTVNTPEPTVTMTLSEVIDLRVRAERAEAAAAAAERAATAAQQGTEALQRAVTGLETALRAIEARPVTPQPQAQTPVEVPAQAPAPQANTVIDVRQPAVAQPVGRHWWGGKRKQHGT